MELSWDEVPAQDPVFFSRDVYDKYSLAPTIKELWTILQSPQVKEEGEKKTCGNPNPPKSTSKRKGNEGPELKVPGAECKESQGDATGHPAKPKDLQNLPLNNFPEPRVPYPCFSSLSKKEQLTYLHALKSKKNQTLPQPLLHRVRNEVLQFMSYLQDVSKMCAEDYNYITPGATSYVEEFFRACLEHMKNFPQVYLVQRITSLTGGKFIPDISLNFEKQLLAMGHIEIAEKKVLPANIQLSIDNETVSSVTPPAKKASYLHSDISSDPNAEKLCVLYEPHVCLTKEAFLLLLSNDPDFTESWELPVWVKMSPGKGSASRKTVYVDSPLLRTLLSQRERSHIFHEESMMQAIKRSGTKPVFFLKSQHFSIDTETPTKEINSRNLMSVNDGGLDFDVDLTELESFGESYKPKSKPNPLSKGLKSPPQKLALAKNACPPKEASTGPPEGAQHVGQEGADSSWSDMEGNSEEDKVTFSPAEQCPRATTVHEVDTTPGLPPAKRPRLSSGGCPLEADSEEECLVIDESTSSLATPVKNGNSFPVSMQGPTSDCTPAILAPPTPDCTLDPPPTQPSDQAVSDAGSPQAPGPRRGTKRLRAPGACDQLGQILRMQKAMLKATQSRSQEPASAPQTPERRTAEQRAQAHPLSLVKPCVSSYLEAGEGQEENAPAPTHINSAASGPGSAQQTRLLADELLVGAEDELDYEAPEEGNVLYKLYSLQGTLLLVRSAIRLARPSNDRGTYCAIPVHVLPKLEYQLRYGAETLTHSEACSLWAETLLHSSTCSVIGRIDAHSSKVVELQELPADWIQNLSCDFKPARSLNILNHLLKRVTELDEGRYLLGHKPREAFITIYRAGEESSRSAYDLRQVHGGLPGTPPTAGVPWVPVDPDHVLPFHRENGRVPCTFPPLDPPHGLKAGRGRPWWQGRGRGGAGAAKPHQPRPGNPPTASRETPNGPNQAGKKKKKKKKPKNRKKKGPHTQVEQSSPD